MSNDYYVYLYLREDGTPYYVGKGKGGRAFSKTGRRMKPPSDKSKIIFHSENLTEDQAFALEKELIAKYGRKDNGTGILRNLTDGGDGSSGHIHSDETKAKISQNNPMKRPEVKAKVLASLNTPEAKAKRRTPEAKAKMLASLNTPEAKAKRIASLRTPEVKAKILASLNTPEVKAKARARTLERISTPEAKAVWMERLNTPEAKAKHKAAMKSPEVRAKFREILNRPDIKAKRTAALEAYYAKKKLERSTSTGNLAPFFMST